MPAPQLLNMYHISALGDTKAELKQWTIIFSYPDSTVCKVPSIKEHDHVLMDSDQVLFIEQGLAHQYHKNITHIILQMLRTIWPGRTHTQIPERVSFPPSPILWVPCTQEEVLMLCDVAVSHLSNNVHYSCA